MALPPMMLSRRRALLWLGAAVVAACTPGDPVPAPVRAPREGASTLERMLGLSEPEARPPATLPMVDPFEPPAGDVLPEAKRVAGRLAQSLTTTAAGGPPDLPPSLLSAAAGLRTAGPSVGEVVTVQLGGLAPDRRTASMLTVVRQHTATTEGLRVVTRTLDLRVRQRALGASWAVDAVASVGGQPAAAPAPVSPTARAVLEHPGIALPDSARWDIERGMIDERLLRTMLEMAGVVPYAATVLASGHPFHVFATRTVSNHSSGRAIDIALVDGLPVVSQHRRGSPAFRLARMLFDRGIPELGAPWDFDDPASRRSFTNFVHADHLHVGFEGPRPRPVS